MAHATADSVLADFNDTYFDYAGIRSRFRQNGDQFFVTTDGPDGELTEYEVLYTFGVDPLQQYLVDLGGGRIQALSIAWDTRPAAAGGQRWFHLYPDDELVHSDPLHWTGPNQNWNFMCADCHVTDYHKGYDAQTQSFSAQWSELGVTCESCHGPGSRHLEWAQGQSWPDKGLSVLLDERRGMHWLHELERVTALRSEPLIMDKEQQVCAQCHSLRSVVAEGYHAGLPLLDFYRPELLVDPLYFADGQQREEVFISGNFAQSKMHQAGVTCSDCHEPHSQKLRAEGNALCSTCHLPTEFDRPEHHFHPANSSGAQCVSCHMPERTYMVIDPRRDHSITVPRPDLAQQLGTPDACTSCHTDREPAWAAQQIVDWFPQGRWQSPSHAVTIAAADQGVPTAQLELAVLVNDPQLAPIVRGSAAQRLDPEAGGGPLAAVIRGLTDPAPLVRLGSIRAIENAPVALRTRHLLPLLDDPLRSVRSLVASLLADAAIPPSHQTGFDRALHEYEQELDINSDRAGHLGQLGLLRLRQGRSGEAEAAWDRAISTEPLHVAAYLNLADLLRSQGREKAAERLLRDALELMPEEGLLHYALGLSLVRQQQRDDALEHFRKAWRLSPEDPRTGYILAVALESVAPGEALELLRVATTRHPNSRELLWAGASFALRHGQQQLARHYIEALLKRDPADQQALRLQRMSTGKKSTADRSANDA
ncbi:MAG: tetratricopeptide repeat protein [Pseudomonas sp.]